MLRCKMYSFVLIYTAQFFFTLKTPASAEIKHKSRRAEKTKDKDEEKEEKIWISQSRIFGYTM